MGAFADGNFIGALRSIRPACSWSHIHPYRVCNRVEKHSSFARTVDELLNYNRIVWPELRLFPHTLKRMQETYFTINRNHKRITFSGGIYALGQVVRNYLRKIVYSDPVLITIIRSERIDNSHGDCVSRL